MEVYEDNNAIMSYPSVTDYSIDLKQVIYYFSRAYRNHCSSCVNRYLFSWDNDFLCIMPIRSQYRVIGRCDRFQPLKRTKYFDVFFLGSLDECISRMSDLVRGYVLIV